jgi:hypothetical protein
MAIEPSRSKRRAPRRNAAAEGSGSRAARRAGFSGPDAKAQLILRGEPAILAFFARELPRLEKEWQVKIGTRFAHVTRDVERIEPRLEIRSSGENWFRFAGGARAPRAASAFRTGDSALLQSGQSSVRLKNRKLAVFDPGFLDEFQQVLADCQPQQRQPGLYRMGQRDAAYWSP